LAPAPALAASSYTVLNVPSVTANSTADLGTIEVQIPNAAALKAGDILTVSLPIDVKFNKAVNNAGVAGNDFGAGTSIVTIDASKNVDNTIPNQVYGNLELLDPFPLAAAGVTTASTIDIKVKNDCNQSNKALFLIRYDDVAVGGISGDITVTISAPTNTGFTSGSVVVGKTTGSTGQVYTSMTEVKSVGAGTSLLGVINISEVTSKAIKQGDTIKLRLPAGVTWAGTPTVLNAWDFSVDPSFACTPTPNERDLTIKITGRDATRGNAGQLRVIASINVNDSEAKLGDIVATVSSADNNFPDQDVVVAKYGEYGVTLEEKTAPEIKAGKLEQKLGEFTIIEGIPGSILPNRTIKLTLPEGVKWCKAPSVVAEKGNDLILSIDKNTDADGVDQYYDSGRTVVLQTVASPSITTPSVLRLENAQVTAEGDFNGDIKLTVGGTAGVTGTVVVGKVVPAVTVEAVTPATNVIIGQQKQAITTLTITEGTKEALIQKKDLKVLLPVGVTFNGTPTVKVIEGDVLIETEGIKTSSSDGGLYRGVLTIPIKSSSAKASKIEISGAQVTIDRTVPEGDLKASVGGNAIFENNAYFPNVTEADSAVAAVCVTPAGQQGRNATFYIGSTIMNVNGANIIMDVAPYIKAGRTYVPVRYLGEALGATTAWDEATKTVTITKDDKSVVLVIGSTIAKVNGADVQMDVAPEITGVGRTMLPARWVAEGLGYAVGWNEVLKQVVIQ
jgi:hypothetical protein